MIRRKIIVSAFALCAVAANAQQQDQVLEEIVVTSDFVEQTVLSIPTSISVIPADLIRQRQAEHLSEILAYAPNVNFSSGASRGRFFQIRGIGERSQFVDPINPGVGLLIDDVDFSGIGNAASLFDIEQVEILRGPQGSRFGANALGGLIALRSKKPTSEFEGQVSAGAGNITSNQGSLDSWQLGLVLSGPLSDTLNGRLAMEQFESDGSVDNTFLDRDDTNNVEQSTVRGRLQWTPTSAVTVDFGLLFVNADNGYDAFTLDNVRDTQSDEPGRDLQRSLAFWTNLDYQLSDTITLQANASHASSDIVYSFDLDWAAPGLCDGTGDPCDAAFWGFSWEYTGFDEYQRDRDTFTVDTRLVITPNDATSYVLGLFGKNQDVDLDRTETFVGSFASAYQTDNLALYGQFDRDLGERWRISFGGRVERFEGEYQDSNAVGFEPDDTSVGGHVSLQFAASDKTLLYARFARGYKAGGANSAGSAVLSQNSPDDLAYEAETLLNYELGLKGNWLDDRLSMRASVFFQERINAQIRQSFVDCSAIPCQFTDFIDNAGEASGQGLEMEVNWLLHPRVELFFSLGLLDAEFDDYLSFSHINADPNTATPFDLSGRDLAQAPNYQSTLAGTFSLSERWTWWLSFEAQDEQFFSNRHEALGENYQILNSRLQYAGDGWTASLWANNLTNETYFTRGFGSFPNDPRNFYAELGPYLQFGDAREIGVSMSFGF